MTGAVRARKPAWALLAQQLWAAALVWPALWAHAGVVFSTIHTFQFFPNGAYPNATLVQGSDGNFYGTTSSCGTNGAGTVFKLNTNGVLTTLYAFTGYNDGGGPEAGLVEGSDGYFYGTTSYGGTNEWGTVFRIIANGEVSSLYSFTGGYDGANP